MAARLVELALSQPAELVPEMGGPRVYGMIEILRGYLRATHQRRPIMRLRMPGGAARAIRSGALITPEHAVGHRTWEDFLADKVAR